MFRNPLAPAALLGTLIFLTVLSPTPNGTAALAGDMTPVARHSADRAGWSLLDGRVFRGEFGPLGKDAMGSDSWVFGDGMFLSKSCLECGFPETPYLVRFEDGKTVFEAKTQCPRTDATIVWRGTVKDGEIEGVYTWVRERWYWTIEKEFWFKGTRVHETRDETTAALR